MTNKLMRICLETVLRTLAEAGRMTSDILYWAAGSAPCWRVMIALEEKGLPDYPNKHLSFEKGEQKSDEVLKLNPRGQVSQPSINR